MEALLLKKEQEVFKERLLFGRLAAYLVPYPAPFRRQRVKEHFSPLKTEIRSFTSRVKNRRVYFTGHTFHRPGTCPHSQAPWDLPPLPGTLGLAPTPKHPGTCPHSQAPWDLPPLPGTLGLAPTPKHPGTCPHSQAP